MEKSNEEKAKELSKKYARQYRHNVYIPFDDVFVFSNEEINNACLKMAEWKDKQFAKEKKRWLKWLKKNAGTYHRFDVTENRFFYNYNTMIDDFQQAMEE